MHVLGYTWAGVRTTDLESATRFFADVSGNPSHPVRQRRIQVLHVG
jgi:hypothetical protein